MLLFSRSSRGNQVNVLGLDSSLYLQIPGHQTIEHRICRHNRYHVFLPSSSMTQLQSYTWRPYLWQQQGSIGAMLESATLSVYTYILNEETHVRDLRSGQCERSCPSARHPCRRCLLEWTLDATWLDRHGYAIQHWQLGQCAASEDKRESNWRRSVRILRAHAGERDNSIGEEHRSFEADSKLVSFASLILARIDRGNSRVGQKRRERSAKAVWQPNR